jgi:hypothetical protein
MGACEIRAKRMQSGGYTTNPRVRDASRVEVVEIHSGAKSK